jgi:hypothetical protein
MRSVKPIILPNFLLFVPRANLKVLLGRVCAAKRWFAAMLPGAGPIRGRAISLAAHRFDAVAARCGKGGSLRHASAGATTDPQPTRKESRSWRGPDSQAPVRATNAGQTLPPTAPPMRSLRPAAAAGLMEQKRRPPGRFTPGASPWRRTTALLSTDGLRAPESVKGAKAT